MHAVRVFALVLLALCAASLSQAKLAERECEGAPGDVVHFKQRTGLVTRNFSRSDESAPHEGRSQVARHCAHTCTPPDDAHAHRF